MRVFLTHVYVIVMAFVIITAANIVAAHYGPRIVSSINGLISGTDQKVEQIHDKVKTWNRDIMN